MGTFIDIDLLLRVIQKQECFDACRPLRDQDFQSCIDLSSGFVLKNHNASLCEHCNKLVHILLIDIHKELQSPLRNYRSDAPTSDQPLQEENLSTSLTTRCKL